ncbi:MAG: DUF4125 family protein [Lachnospiraceae bacterium]|nr:DUF4125 family protein [Lachnospiraceae bacterium]
MQRKQDELIERVIAAEWQQFDRVKNEGGRASCQDDFETFYIMRKSQYLLWEEEMLESFLQDLQEAEKRGWNLITEKYARMMKSTASKEYALLEKDLPVRSKEREAISENIIRIQVAWMEEFAKKFPKTASNARSIHTYEDGEYNTSYETYLRGELGTYSEETFLLYGRWIAKAATAGRNIAYEIMTETVKMYGYESVEAKEEKEITTDAFCDTESKTCRCNGRK